KALDELLLKWHDRSLTAEELVELNALLAQAEARARLRQEFDFDADLIEAIKALQVLTTAQEQAQAFQTLEIRQTEPFVRKPSRILTEIIGNGARALVRAAGGLRWRYAFGLMACLALAVAAWWFWPARAVVARIQGSIGDVMVDRGGRLYHATTG